MEKVRQQFFKFFGNKQGSLVLSSATAQTNDNRSDRGCDEQLFQMLQPLCLWTICLAFLKHKLRVALNKPLKVGHNRWRNQARSYKHVHVFTSEIKSATFRISVLVRRELAGNHPLWRPGVRKCLTPAISVKNVDMLQRLRYVSASFATVKPLCEAWQATRRFSTSSKANGWLFVVHRVLPIVASL